jgi:hypothetical protein
MPRATNPWVSTELLVYFRRDYVDDTLCCRGNTPGKEQVMAIDIFVEDPQQAAFERKSIEIFQTPEVQKQLDIARKLFAADPLAQTPSGRATLERSVGETVRAAADWIVNGDPYRPSLVWVQTPPHKWFGVDFPGNRWGIDNPDNLYATAAIDGESRYVIHGKLRRPAPAECTLTVMGRGGPYPNAFPHSNAYLSLDNVKIGTDDSFEVTIDSSPVNGRPNHMQSQPQSMALLLRPSLGDWSTETPPLISIERVGGPPMRPAPSNAELVTKAVEKLREFIPAVLDFNRKACYRLAANQLTVPTPTPGGLLTQITSFGHFKVADDEALVLTIDPIGARYLGFQLCDHWMIGMEYISATGCINHAQAARNNDGTYTLVISPSDPGVYNWVDTEHLGSGEMLIRWQALPHPPKDENPSIAKSRLVKLAQLGDVLPLGTRMADAQARRRQIDQRERAFARRIGQLRR